MKCIVVKIIHLFVCFKGRIEPLPHELNPYLPTANIEENIPLTAAAADAKHRITKARLCMDTAWTLNNVILCNSLCFEIYL